MKQKASNAKGHRKITVLYCPLVNIFEPTYSRFYNSLVLKTNMR